MTWHPTTNLTQTDLLTEEQLSALKAWPHGYELYASGVWVSCLPVWSMKDAVYRGKPSPLTTSVWIVRSSHTVAGPFTSKEDASACSGYIDLIRIDTCDGVSTAHLEGLKDE